MITYLVNVVAVASKLKLKQSIEKEIVMRLPVRSKDFHWKVGLLVT